MDTTFIYALNDPETGECRYVGKANNPHDRLFGPQGHLKNCHKKRHSACWIRSLVARGLVPHLEILQEVPVADWPLWERVWIKASRKIGMDLTNATDGGDAVPSFAGRSHLPETRAKISASQKGDKNHHFGKMGMQHTSFGRKSPKASSRFRGVGKHKATGKWYAQITISGKSKYLGIFLNEIEAARAVDAAALKYFGPTCRLNFPG